MGHSSTLPGAKPAGNMEFTSTGARLDTRPASWRIFEHRLSRRPPARRYAYHPRG